MINNQQLTTTSDTKVFTASTTGAAIGGAVTAQNRAVTNIILCNTGAVTITDESINRTSVDVYLVKQGETPVDANKIVSSLTVPAGETVFFSDEKIILDGGDEVWVKAADANLITVTTSSLPV
tara:strand:+ start:22 stop:390 length:369 start_codon:yes stop_codon:yes gene_type:complete